jgi:hypothetical protein
MSASDLMRLRLLLIPLAICLGFALGRLTIDRTSAPPPTAKPVVVAPSRSAPPASSATPSFADWLASVLSPQPDDSGSDADIDPVASYEDLMYAQPDLVDASLRRLRAHKPGVDPPGTHPPATIDLYALGFAGDGDENVFRNEVDYLPKLLAQRFGADGRTLQLINSPDTFKRTPLATRTNLYHALQGIAKTMDPDNDILLLFLTSHGSHDHQLFVAMNAMPLDQLTPADIRDALDTAHIRWRVVVISACYSGGFIPALREPHTMIITAARADRTSFGCGSDSQITWFGKAFLTQALNQTTDFHEAYLRASQEIAAWEKRDKQTPSEPQFWEGSLIQQHMNAWRASLPPGAPVVFTPASVATPSHHTGG